MILTGANMEKTGRAQHSPGRLTAPVILADIARVEREAEEANRWGEMMDWLQAAHWRAVHAGLRAICEPPPPLWRRLWPF